MPLHCIYTASGLYTPSEKSAMAKAITALYTNAMPAFYVVVLFVDVDKDSYFIGGEPNDKFVRVTIQHLARQFANDETKVKFMHMYEQAVKHFTADKGLDWEINVVDADPITWHENGMSPPAPNSEGEALWKKTNKAVPYQGPSFSDHELADHKP